MVDHLQSRVTPWRQYASHVKVGGTLSKMDVLVIITIMKCVVSKREMSAPKRAIDSKVWCPSSFLLELLSP